MVVHMLSITTFNSARVAEVAIDNKQINKWDYIANKTLFAKNRLLNLAGSLQTLSVLKLCNFPQYVVLQSTLPGSISYQGDHISEPVALIQFNQIGITLLALQVVD